MDSEINTWMNGGRVGEGGTDVRMEVGSEGVTGSTNRPASGGINGWGWKETKSMGGKSYSRDGKK